MVIEVKNIKENPVNALRRLGYSFQRNEGEEMSFVKPFGASGYPRFHMYVKMSGMDMKINIHLDAKKETYGEDTRHHGEYENTGALAEEVRRLKAILG
ncbi:MAG: hypothetical protein WC022_01125 [Parcubacteria group bacterium]